MDKNKLARRLLVYRDIKTDYEILDSYVKGIKSYDKALKDLNEKGLVTGINYNSGLFEIYYHGILGIVEDILDRPVLINKFKINAEEFINTYDLRNEIDKDEIFTMKDLEKLIQKAEEKI